MSNRDIQICHDYSEAVFRRGIEPMEPLNFSPNWADQPSRYKVYSGVERMPLPAKLPSRLASMAEIMERISAPQPDARGLTYEQLAMILLVAHGALNRRVDVNWNRDNRDRSRYFQANYGRGTASGGGMYPTEIFWACGPSGPLLPGIYHYDNGHHAMARLLSGDVTRRVRAAVARHPAAMKTDQFLLISLNFWKNSFKYNSFCYHVVTQDLGALLASLRFMAAGFDSDLRFLFWYADEELNRVLGLETLLESVFVVVPISTTASGTPTQQAPGDEERHQKLEMTLVHKTSFQRSKEIIRFPTIEEVHLSALIEDEPRPDVKEAFRASSDEFAVTGEKVVLPAPATELLQSDVLQVFKKRRSSFGRFSNHTPLTLKQFATMLYFASASRNYVSDLKLEEGSPHFTRLLTFVNNVEGIKRGAYAYDWNRHCLWTIAQQDYSLFLQEHYFLQNYNLSEVAALLVIAGRPDRMMEIYGNRGYRMINAEVGLVAQSIYMAATALSFNCGAALGFDNIALNTELGFDGSDQRSFLFLLVGNGPAYNGNFDARLV